ncbi:bifunctional hydroxymethylpyrimidine kinase/phosphomethylpyrimidine kinase [Stappia stellulata]|uniref:bifunctional hydroxymethylpyrimidine kinase/phosphomethylpyrimidine kinase n=1 Tax=Stappia stellulata TaxID=71235 RepID=UPI001CD6F7E7|nr:bifunctional hydroxymethylpyrimidine kinase/phosphomethylpyrimidine kinase [Stappia stellulata]MCA1244177.1 bifunctional hydroxymethylpyrimidine kinase/phosphomethylpyrimidine kinase [Stappia stellulata]
MDATTRDGTAETGHHGAGKQAPPAIALTIAGSDSGGGAGIQADLKAFSALGVYGASAITAITAQNTRAVTHIHDIPLDVVAGQIAAVLDDLNVAAVKIGMLSSPEIVETVAGALGGYRGPVVLDPVMVAKSGAALLRPEAVAAVRDILVPRATLMTPNLPEAALLLGEKAATDLAAAERQGRALAALGPAVLMKGGHAQGAVCTDLLIAGDLPSLKLKARRLETKNTHGTGCTLSAAIAAALAKGADLPQAVRDAHAYLHGAISCADELRVGSGHGPVHHFYRQWGRA